MSNPEYTPAFVQKCLRNYLYFRSTLLSRMDENLIIVCADIDRALNSVNLTERQKEVLHYYMLGYTLEDIGHNMNISHPAVIGLIKRLSKKLANFLEGGTLS